MNIKSGELNKKGLNCQEKGRQNLKIVEKYVATVDIADVPLNQFKMSSRKKIVVDILGISKSSLENLKVKKAFDKLDKRLNIKKNKIKVMKTLESNMISQLKREINILQNKLALIETDNRALKQNKINEYWLKKYGRIIRP